MVQSMTGYGKSETLHENNKLTIELRSVNGKGSDVNIKTQVLPREREYEVKQMISQSLQRGTIDLFATIEYSQESSFRRINKGIFGAYLEQIRELALTHSMELNDGELLSAVLRNQDIYEQTAKDSDESFWLTFKAGVEQALVAINNFRSQEGARLAAELAERVNNITALLKQVEEYEGERINLLKQRITNRLDELKTGADPNRLEQELIYYIEKLDITEEKVRLGQHCKYFIDTMSNEPNPGKKLGFIAQEMGREINTLGSKANHASIQKYVVQMKDELEKIKEQSLNIL